MIDLFSLRRAVARLFIVSTLSLAGLSAFAVPLPPPGVPVFADPQLQACFDELALANGWTMTEEVTALTCPDRIIDSLEGLQFLVDLRELYVSGNRISSAYPIEPLPQLEILDLSGNRLFDTFPLRSLTNLKRLNLSGNSGLQPGDVQVVIFGNPGLTHIGVAGIPMGGLSWLPFPGPMGEYDLQELDISDTGSFADIAPVTQYANLRVLKAAGNQIVSAWPLDVLMQLEVLDLSDNNLDSVFPLQWLQNLKQLNLSFNSHLQPSEVQSMIQANRGLTHIAVAGISMGDLSWLPPSGPFGEYDLQELDISDTGAFPVLAPLVQYPNLRVLRAAGNRIAGVWQLDLLTQLEVLDLSDNKLVDTYPLQGLQSLRQLNLSSNNGLKQLQVQDIIQANPGLTHIAVAGIAMDDLNWLPPIGPLGEYDLQDLDISHTGSFADLAPLVQYPNLRVLKAAGNQFVSAWPLDLLPQIEVLDLSGNKLWDVFPLQGLHNLERLDLSSNSRLQRFDVQDIIYGNPRLTHIGVAGIDMGDLSWLPFPGPMGEYDLQELDISNTGSFPDLAPVVPYVNLRVLKAAGNRIVSASPLDSLAQLEVLDLSDNHLVDFAPLQSLYNLKRLYLSNNKPLHGSSPTTELFTLNQIITANPGLTHLGVAGVAIGNLSQLAIFSHPNNSLPYPLVELDVSNTGLFNLEPVRLLDRLRVLKAGSNNIGGSYGLESWMQLQVLDLSHNDMTEIWQLQGMTTLTQLNLTGNSQLQAFEVVNVVQSNPALTHIGVGGIAMGNLGWLPLAGPQGEYDLVELDISSIGMLIDPFELAQYPNLKVLRASGNAIQNVWWLDQLQLLEVLDLSNNRLLDTGTLTGLRNLRELYLSGNVPADLLAPGIDLFAVNQVIAVNPGLTRLGVGGVQIGQLDQLAVFDPANGINIKLLELDISDTGISDVAAVAGLPELRTLNASANQLVDAQPLVLLQRLAVVDLSNNDIHIVVPLADIVSLRLLDLRGNDNIQCAELDELEVRLLPGVLLRPEDCIVMTPPTVVIVSPTLTESYYSTSFIDFTANANDLEDGNLDAQIQWTSDLLGSIGTGSSFTSTLSAGEHVITATVTDSHGNTSGAGLAVTVLFNTAPELTITSVQDGALFNEGEDVILAALANDAEEGDLSPAIQWSSSLDGVLGSGATIQPPLSVGTHIITASITDAAGAKTERLVSVRINGLPTLSLQSPLDGAVYQQGDNVSLVASASDPEDGALDAGIQWSSSLDGLLGASAQLTVVLSVGNHVITASITDSDGATVIQSRTVSINSPPQLTLLSPSSGSLFMLQEIVKLTATANDLEDGNISALIQWSSNLDGSLGTGGALKANLSLGQHTLTARITDSHGGTHALTTVIMVDQIDLAVVVSGNGRKKTASLTWSGSRNSVDIYKDGVIVGTGEANGTATYRFKDQAVFRVCETGTNYCSIDVVAQ